jgi:hypothetical protein
MGPFLCDYSVFKVQAGLLLNSKDRFSSGHTFTSCTAVSKVDFFSFCPWHYTDVCVKAGAGRHFWELGILLFHLAVPSVLYTTQFCLSKVYVILLCNIDTTNSEYGEFRIIESAKFGCHQLIS